MFYTPRLHTHLYPIFLSISHALWLSFACSGINDIAVGAFIDNDSRTGTGDSRGAVYILFLNRDGTVKAEQKISDTQGGLTTPLNSADYFGVAVAGVGDLDNE